MVELELALGSHNVLWTLAGYADLEASITVAEGGVTCDDVTEGACYTAAPVTAPGVLITAATPFSVVGYLAEAAADIYSWLTEKGGKEDVGSADFVELKMAYLGIMPLPFTTTSSHVVGTKYYYFFSITGDHSWIDMGDGFI